MGGITGKKPLLDKVATGSYLCDMRAVGIKELKNKLSEYIRLVAGGETILVTDRDRIVAELVPPREDRSPMLADAFLADAVRKGWITRAAMPGTGPPPKGIPVMSLSELLRELEKDREDR